MSQIYYTVGGKIVLSGGKSLTKNVAQNVVYISAGYDYSIAITSNTNTFSWGNNSNGQLGDNTIISKLTPASILGTKKNFLLNFCWI